MWSARPLRAVLLHFLWIPDIPLALYSFWITVREFTPATIFSGVFPSHSASMDNTYHHTVEIL
jgi:hypothetical protein